MTIVDVQFSPAHCEWAELRDACLAADAGPFGALWVYDHLAGRTLAGGHTNLECFSLLGALAELTERIELGTLVANVWNRQVGTLVTAAASVAIVSGRQFHLGIGAGTSPRSKFAREQLVVAAQLADSLDDRHRRVEEVLDLAERMWAPDRDEAFAGFPLPSPTPTRIVGVNSVQPQRDRRPARRRHQRAVASTVARRVPRRRQRRGGAHGATVRAHGLDLLRRGVDRPRSSRARAHA